MKFLRIVSFNDSSRRKNQKGRVFIFELKEDYDSLKFDKDLTYINFFNIIQTESKQIYAPHLTEKPIKADDFFEFFEEEENSKRHYRFYFRNHLYYYLGEFLDGEAFFQKIKYVLNKRYISLEDFLNYEKPNSDKAESLTSGFLLPIQYKIKKTEEKEVYRKLKEMYFLRLNQHRVGFTRTRKMEHIREEADQDAESSFFWITKYKNDYIQPISPMISIAFSVPTDDKKTFFNLVFHGIGMISSFPIITEMFYNLIQHQKDFLSPSEFKIS
ncbi:MAG: hypothetical protein ACK4UJ_00655 [Leptonema sp. (in: bacteria)]